MGLGLDAPEAPGLDSPKGTLVRRRGHRGRSQAHSPGLPRLGHRDFGCRGHWAHLWRAALASHVEEGPPYGPLRPADGNGLALAEGFQSRVIGTSGTPVIGTVASAAYVWHDFPDGGAVFPAPDGGWVYASNSEVPFAGGVGAVRFDAGGNVVDAYRLLAGTSQNCAGGPTPWGTWLSCEEHPWGFVWELDPFAPLPEIAPVSQDPDEAFVRTALGRFQHEAAAVDPDSDTPAIYLTEDRSDGLFYRFVPDSTPADRTQPWDLGAGRLEAADVEDLAALFGGGSSPVRWHEVPDPQAFEGQDNPTRHQDYGEGEPTVFDGGEGTWFADGIVYFTTKGDDRVWAYDTVASAIELVYQPPGVLDGVDNVFVSGESGEIFVAEDHQSGDPIDIVVIMPDRTPARLLRAEGPFHSGSELAGPALIFSPDDPDGFGRFYFSSQRAFGRGATYEVRGPFHRT